MCQTIVDGDFHPADKPQMRGNGCQQHFIVNRLDQIVICPAELSRDDVLPIAESCQKQERDCREVGPIVPDTVKQSAPVENRHGNIAEDQIRATFRQKGKSVIPIANPDCFIAGLDKFRTNIIAQRSLVFTNQNSRLVVQRHPRHQDIPAATM